MLQVNIIMITITHKILVLVKITRILRQFLRRLIHLNVLEKQFILSQYIMMESSSLEEEKMIKGRKNIFRLKKEIDGTAYGQKDITNIFRLKKENKVVKDRMLSDIGNL